MTDRADDQSLGHKLRAGFAALISRRNRVLYELDGNGFHALQTYRDCRKLGQPVPGWVLEYFDHCIGRVLDGELRTGPEIAAAFALTGSGKGGRRGPARTASRDLGIMECYVILKGMDPERTNDSIFEQIAAEQGMAFERVREVWYEFRRDVQ